MDAVSRDQPGPFHVPSDTKFGVPIGPEVGHGEAKFTREFKLATGMKPEQLAIARLKREVIKLFHVVRVDAVEAVSSTLVDPCRSKRAV